MTSSNITVQWEPVDCIHHNGDITGYSVQYGTETMSVSGDSSGGMYVISGLMPSTTYSIQVAAETSAGTGPYSDSLIAPTDSEEIVSIHARHSYSIFPLHGHQLYYQCHLSLHSPPLIPSPSHGHWLMIWLLLVTTPSPTPILTALMALMMTSLILALVRQ